MDGQRHGLAVEYLPGYAHDLDPVEGLRANLKGVELANLRRDTIAEVLEAAWQGSAGSARIHVAAFVPAVLRAEPMNMSPNLFREDR